ncbi:MAG: hypothetical protein ACM3NR_04460 [Methanosarcina sp.]
MEILEKENILDLLDEVTDDATEFSVDETQFTMISGVAVMHSKGGVEEKYITPNGEVFNSLQEAMDKLSQNTEKVSNCLTLGQMKNNQLSGQEVIESIKSILKQHIYLTDESEYTLLALYVLMTYSYQLFRRIPYINLKGPKGSGKTTVMEILQHLVQGPEILSNVSAASLFRMIEQRNPTLLIDEVEHLGIMSNSNHPLVQLLNSGYQKDGKTVRIVQGCPISFSTYSPKILAGISNLTPTTEDRCILIPMQKAKSRLKTFVYDPAMENEFMQLKRHILTHLSRNSKNIVSYIHDPESLGVDARINNRNLDLWFPILTLAKVFSADGGSDYFDEIGLLALKEIERKQALEDALPENACKKILAEFLKNTNPAPTPLDENKEHYYFDSDAIFKTIDETDTENRYSGKADLTNTLKKIGVTTERRRFKGKPNPITVYKIPRSIESWL